MLAGGAVLSRPRAGPGSLGTVAAVVGIGQVFQWDFSGHSWVDVTVPIDL